MYEFQHIAAAFYLAAGVGALSYISDSYGFFCSGCLLNRDPTDFLPLFMTANHCGVRTNNVDSLLITWFYQTSVCNGTPPNPNTLPQTAGRACLINDTNTDFTLVVLRDELPGGTYFLGWDAGYWANGSASAGIHHPRGTYKRISFGTKQADITSCVGSQNWYVELPDGNGDVEPGSSGAPAMDSSHRVRGPESCANWACNSANVVDYGRFDLAWPNIGPFLQPANPVYVNRAFGGTEQGTLANPFRTVFKAGFAVTSGSDVHIEAGNYNERLTLDRPMRLNSRNGVAALGR